MDHDRSTVDYCPASLVPNARRGQLVAHCHNLYSCGRRGNDSTGTGPAHFDELRAGGSHPGQEGSSDPGVAGRGGPGSR